jgi:peptide/nickel transport system substrate-binding protein
MKRATLILTFVIAVSLLLAACAPATPVDTGNAGAAADAEARIAELEAQLAAAQEGAVSEEELIALQQELEAARAEAEAAAAAAAEQVAAQPAPEAYARNETLYISGTQWGPPSSWNPFMQGNYATGTIGFVYETLFLYDPLADEYIPWLAESGEWVSDNVYELTIREGITWSDGTPFTAEDVKFTYELGQQAPISFSPLWDWLDSIEVDGNTLTFTFNEPLYQEWANYLYSNPIVPKHLWEGRSADEIASGANENPIGTGPYLYETHDQDRMVWVKNENWWGTEILGMEMKPTRVVDIVNAGNNVALARVLQNEVDLSNNFLPGIATLMQAGYPISTYYDEPPYMLSANTAWLIMNLQMSPMDDVAFRRAMAYAIDVDQIVEVVYGNIVQKANPTGLLPIWDEYVDQAVVEELGFTYDPEMAAQILADAGYVDIDGDGFVETPDGEPIELGVAVPAGWTDWMEAARVIAESAQAVGINVQPEFPDYAVYLDARLAGTFEMAIDNQEQMSNTVWTYYDWIFQNPIEDIATMGDGNYGRYDNQEAFDLVEQLDKTPIDDVEAMKEITSQLQRIQLTDMPLIPLWYNGLWAQVNSTTWTNWPSAAEDTPNYLPATWRGYWNMGAIRMLAEIEPVEASE